MTNDPILAYLPPRRVGECSGLKVNLKKTEALVFGDSSLWEGVSNMYTLRNVIKILGIYFGGNGKERDDLK